MKLDRNINKSTKGKYALIRLRNIEQDSEAAQLLVKLWDLGYVDFGCVGEKDEFFVIKLRDIYSPAAIKGYANAVMEAASAENDLEKARDKTQYALQVQELQNRAGSLSPFCKEPD